MSKVWNCEDIANKLISMNKGKGQEPSYDYGYFQCVENFRKEFTDILIKE